MDPVSLYFTLLLAGLLLLCLEIVVPGGVLGVLGGIALILAVAVGFAAFSGAGGVISAAAIILMSGLTIVVWIKYFPHTVMGRILTLANDAKTFKSSDAHPELVGKEGVATSTLRPAGIATIDGARVDVVAEGSWIEHGSPIRVVGVEGNRVTVREIKRT